MDGSSAFVTCVTFTAALRTGTQSIRTFWLLKKNAVHAACKQPSRPRRATSQRSDQSERKSIDGDDKTRAMVVFYRTGQTERQREREKERQREAELPSQRRARLTRAFYAVYFTFRDQGEHAILDIFKRWPLVESLSSCQMKGIDRRAGERKETPNELFSIRLLVLVQYLFSLDPFCFLVSDLYFSFSSCLGK